MAKHSSFATGVSSAWAERKSNCLLDLNPTSTPFQSQMMQSPATKIATPIHLSMPHIFKYKREAESQ
jgi:hypothetical protein